MIINNLKISNWFKKNKKKNKEYFMSLVEDGHGYSLLKDSSNSWQDNEFIYETALEVDNIGYMPYEVGMELDKIINDPNSEYIIGIHCTRNPNEGMIDKIFKEGLINNGHLASGASDGFTSISSTVAMFRSLPNSFIEAIKYIKYGRYGFGDRIIFKIPKSYLGESKGEVKPIFYENDGIMRILPEFILGSLTVDENQVVSNFKYNPNYKDTHENLPTGFTIKIEPVILANNQIGAYHPRLDEYYNDLNGNLFYDSSIDTVNKFGKILEAYQKLVYNQGNDFALMALVKLINDGDASLLSNNKDLGIINIPAFIANQLGVKYVYDAELRKLSIDEASRIRKQNNKEILDAFLAYAQVNSKYNNPSKHNNL